MVGRHRSSTAATRARFATGASDPRRVGLGTAMLRHTRAPASSTVQNRLVREARERVLTGPQGSRARAGRRSTPRPHDDCWAGGPRSHPRNGVGSGHTSGSLIHQALRDGVGLLPPRPALHDHDSSGRRRASRRGTLDIAGNRTTEAPGLVVTSSEALAATALEPGRSPRTA